MYSVIFAQIKNKALSTSLQAQDGPTFIAAFIPKLLIFGISVGGLIFLFMLLMGGLKWITSGGDKAQVEAARSQITQAITGVIILFSIIAITKVVETMFGISLLTINLSAFFQ